MSSSIATCLLVAFLSPGALVADESDQIDNVNDIPNDLVVPDVTESPSAAGQRFRVLLPEFVGTQLFHLVYLPTNWSRDKSFPVIVEYPGNGGFRNSLGDVSTGRMEDSVLGYGFTEGKDFIWVCLPFVDPVRKQHQLRWWGDADATAAYCRKAVSAVCSDFGGDSGNVILTGFSRGALACSYIGLRDDETAKLWKALITVSHYDGVRQWNYANSDVESARRRLKRFEGKPQLILQEESVAAIDTFLDAKADFAIETKSLPWSNHTSQWALKNVPVRNTVRQWLKRQVWPSKR